MPVKRSPKSRSTSNRSTKPAAITRTASPRRIGIADPSEEITVTLRLRRKPGHPELPDQLHWARTPPGKRTFLSRAEMADTFGAGPKDIAAVKKFASANRLKFVEASVARRSVLLSGTVRQMNRVFGVDLGIYQSPDDVYRGHEGSPTIPKAISKMVEGVFGLDNRTVLRRNSSPGVPSAGAALLTPPQVANLYGVKATRSRGAGQTVGIIEFGGGYIRRLPHGIDVLPDIDAFFTGLGLDTPKITDVLIDGAINDQSPWDYASYEVALDIDVAGSVAPEANIVVYFAPSTKQGMIDAISTAVHDAVNAPSILSISWGAAELTEWFGTFWDQSTVETVGETFAEAAAMGVSVFAASGDDGSNCDVDDGAAHVQYPASDPWVTSCGGTIITNVAQSGFQENTWNDISGPAIRGSDTTGELRAVDSAASSLDPNGKMQKELRGCARTAVASPMLRGMPANTADTQSRFSACLPRSAGRARWPRCTRGSSPGLTALLATTWAT